jgi:hypothetical protein
MQIEGFVNSRTIPIKGKAAMRNFRLIVLLGLLLLLLSACSAGSTLSAPTAASLPSSPAIPASSTPVSPDSSEIKGTNQNISDACVACHTSKERLLETGEPKANKPLPPASAAHGVSATPKEAWEKVFIDWPKLDNTVHGHIACVDCHGGQNVDDKQAAHQGMVRNPSADPQSTCGDCHKDIVQNYDENLHVNLQGFSTKVLQRSMPASHATLNQALQEQCSSCHTTCGDCHISQPASVGGGLINGHVFNRTPDMLLNCAACHNNGSGNEFLGDKNGQNADVHYQKAGMTCTSCHNNREMHGQSVECQNCHPGPMTGQPAPLDHRFASVQAPRCETCHTQVTTGQDDIVMHKMHGANLSCQVCHSVAYTNCEGCHVSKDKQTGAVVQTLDNSFLGFFIGKNPIQSYERPYRYVPVRHIPITQDTFSAYGNNLLQNFDNLETWTYTVPHNIQRNTPQTASCNGCHGNPQWFLTADKVTPQELKANQDVIVDQLPPLISSSDQIP